MEFGVFVSRFLLAPSRCMSEFETQLALKLLFFAKHIDEITAGGCMQPMLKKYEVEHLLRVTLSRLPAPFVHDKHSTPP